MTPAYTPVVFPPSLGRGFTPLRDVLVVRPDPPVTKTPGGIVLVEPEDGFAVDKAIVWGTVVQTGPGKRSEKTGEMMPMTVVAGDRVAYSPRAGKEIAIAGEPRLLLYEDMIEMTAERGPRTVVRFSSGHEALPLIARWELEYLPQGTYVVDEPAERRREYQIMRDEWVEGMFRLISVVLADRPKYMQELFAFTRPDGLHIFLFWHLLADGELAGR